jgi:hypothetical protein
MRPITLLGYPSISALSAISLANKLFPIMRSIVESIRAESPRMIERAFFKGRDPGRI